MAETKEVSQEPKKKPGPKTKPQAEKGKNPLSLNDMNIASRKLYEKMSEKNQ